jgi:exopolysaccharide production protein ExoZ
MRLYTLDYLRGFAALGIMMYHYQVWAYQVFDASTTLGRIGVYGVSIFYVLSGLTLNVVYRDKMNNFAQVKDFFTKRIFRIYPLLWIATIIATMFIIFSGEMPGRMKFLLNITGLFGFVRPHDSIANGAWSIGNELVFYAIFPLLILAMKRKLLIIPIVISLALYLLFAFVFLGPNHILAHNWPVYTNPLNQLFLFVAGFTIGMFNYKNTTVATILLVASITAFILMPTTGDLVNVVIGYERIIYTILSITICYSFYMLNNKMPVLHKPLSKLGEASYSVYSLHPLVFTGMKYIIKDKETLWMVCVPLTIALAYLMYLKLEKPFIEIGKMINKVPTKREAITI